MKEEIVGGLRNAVERGFSLESAKRSMINAGYSQGEVEEAAQELSQGAITMMNQRKMPEKRELYPSLETPQAQQYSAPAPAGYQPLPLTVIKEENKKKQAKKGLIITLGIVLGLLLLGLLGMIFFADKLLQAISGRLIG